MRTYYYARKSKHRKRRKGFYPALCLFGIHDKCTPALASEVSMVGAALCSLEEAQQMLHNEACDLNVKTIRNIIKRYVIRARLSQDREGNAPFSDARDIAGRRVVISTDGGRVRIRRNKRSRKTQKGRNRYHTDWREPKLLIIYVVNEQGKMDRQINPFIDGTLDGPNAVFGLLQYYLQKLNIVLADKLLFVADGALWIWDRVKKLIHDLGLCVDQVLELLDFYHAAEHLHVIASLKKSWTLKMRRKWVRLQKRRFLKGRLEQALEEIKMVCKGTKNKELRRERDYFVRRNKNRLCYVAISALNMPIGSGAIESSIRRVVNLRLKGPAIFWKEDTANEMLLLRCFYKAKRWGMLHKLACQGGYSGV